ncbi:ABC transporter ATP-binding protein/permease [Lichenihabitans sp. PAMC28606]|uniref:ABCB family ABC transporter ATP-binding protein/permease n=1 Tax=Lichenihabitans sp. PAMC28606 TaxID=2880932 RepID=UPI001D0A5341|nr:ABC transporter ATP-binding protein/permease [Lichenihabitans sp. PAMC28606]UDL95269.1 ABC transporter ATP-binding protein/permease [Lichenihabitans sp. PAMC28606]
MTHQTLPVAGPAAPSKPRVKAEASLFTTVRNLWPYIWPSDRADLRRRIYAALVLLIVAKLITIAIPYSFKWATDAVVGKADHGLGFLPSDMTGPVALTVAYGVLRIVMALFTQGRDALFASVAMHAVRRLATEVFVHLHELSLRYHLERKTGGLTRVLERGRTAIETIVRMIMLTGVPTAVEFVLILAVFTLQFDWLYALAVTIMIIAYMLFTTVATNWRIAIRQSMNESDQDANTKAIDSLLNFETVKYFGAEEREADRYDRSMARYEKLSVKTYTSLAFLNAGQALIFSVGLAVVMIMCLRGIRAGHNTVGDFVLVNAMMIQLYQPLNFMGLVYREVKQAIIDIELMFSILDQSAEVKDKPGALDLKVTEGRVRFEHVNFGYDPAREILKDVSFEIAPGQTVAVVGPSGAGKSTLSRLMFRFYEASSGRITIDGQDILNVTQKSLRSAIGMVPQDTVLFNDSIEYNIRYGRWEASPADIREAAKDAQIDQFITSVPGGYDAQVGERGLKLSGGEKQRVAIARTILKAPPVLVLDEATSALDSFTEREIQDALVRVSRGRTTLVIAHRLSTVVAADQILVLVKGVIAERGTHDELLLRGGTYAAMWNRQRQADAARDALRRADEEGDDLAEHSFQPASGSARAAE